MNLTFIQLPLPPLLSPEWISAEQKTERRKTNANKLSSVHEYSVVVRHQGAILKRIMSPLNSEANLGQASPIYKPNNCRSWSNKMRGNVNLAHLDELGKKDCSALIQVLATNFPVYIFRSRMMKLQQLGTTFESIFSRNRKGHFFTKKRNFSVTFRLSRPMTGYLLNKYQ